MVVSNWLFGALTPFSTVAPHPKEWGVFVWLKCLSSFTHPIISVGKISIAPNCWLRIRNLHSFRFVVFGFVTHNRLVYTPIAFLSGISYLWTSHFHTPIYW
jgi:hypothetical protein